MIQDIEGRDIVIGDECYMPGNNRLFKIKIVKETPKALHYQWARSINNEWAEYSQHTTYSIKNSRPCKNLVKIC